MEVLTLILFFLALWGSVGLVAFFGLSLYFESRGWPKWTEAETGWRAWLRIGVTLLFGPVLWYFIVMMRRDGG